MSLNPGQTLQNGSYTVVRELRRGQFDITYLSTRSDGNRWAIKVLNSHVLASLNREERSRLETQFWQEAVKLEKCSDSPHIVRTEMPFKEGTLFCLPMECLDGHSLGDRSTRILTEQTALDYIRQIGEALTVMHGQKLVHRNICPSTIGLRIVNGNVEAVLTEFGLAMDCDTELSRTRKTEIKDGFSPIELYSRSQPVGPYTDVYSLAATLYELLTGEVPTSAESRKVKGQTLKSPQEKNSDISGKTTKAILAGMKLLPEKRPQSVNAWLSMLGIGHLQNASQNASGTQEETSVDWAKWQTIWAAVATIVTLLVGIPAWLAWKQPEPQPEPSEPSDVQPSSVD